MTVEVSLRFAGGSHAPSAARHAIDRLEPHLDERVLEDLRLLVSELVTNSIRHGRVGATGYVGLDVSVSCGTVRVEVSDPGSGFDPSPRDPDRSHPGGWGLYLVKEIADRWGVQREEDSRVWFEIDRPHDAEEGAGWRTVCA